MAKRASSDRHAVQLEYRFDRLLIRKLEQVYQLLVPEIRRPVGSMTVNLPAYKSMGTLFPKRHNRKSDFHSYIHSLADAEVKAMSRNIACSSKDWLELPAVCLEPDFDLKG